MVHGSNCQGLAWVIHNRIVEDLFPRVHLKGRALKQLVARSAFNLPVTAHRPAD
jgi:hypothetical protein